MKKSQLAYHYEQRWLYQDISDTLHPQLSDLAWSSKEDLINSVGRLLEARNVDAVIRGSVLDQVKEVKEGKSFSLLLSGLMFTESESEFQTRAEWNAVPVTDRNRDLFLHVFNDFSNAVSEVKFARDFLQKYVDVDPRPGSLWMCMRDMLTAMEYAHRELNGQAYFAKTSRGYLPNRGTTWLTYVTFRFEPKVPPALEAFLVDAANREEILAQYVTDPNTWVACTKLPLPLGGTLAFLLNGEQAAWRHRERMDVIAFLRETAPADSFARLEGWRLSRLSCPLPLQLVQRFEFFVAESALTEHLCKLPASE